MQIEIISVSTEWVNKGKSGYGSALVKFKSDKGEQEKKIMSFSNPAVYNEITKNAKPGDKYEIQLTKEGNFWNWSGATKSAGAVADVPAKLAGVTATRSTYETPEERAVKQRLIVRQSSLSNAIDVLTTGAKTPPNVDDITALADKFVAYVYEAPDLFDQPNDLNGDIPF